MRYPTATSVKDFNDLWYNAYKFGKQTSYGYHEGDDLNLKSGGDSDIGQPLYAVGDGKIVYYHNASHPESGFGHHLVLECDTPFGKRWFHYAHCQPDGFPTGVREVREGEVIARLGKSGRPRNELPAHLHFACFKVDPQDLPRGIDTIASTIQQLNDWWESPLALIDKVNAYQPPTNNDSTTTPSLTDDQKRALEALEDAHQKFPNDNLESLARKIPDLIRDNESLTNQVEGLTRQLEREKELRKEAEDEAEKQAGLYGSEVERNQRLRDDKKIADNRIEELLTEVKRLQDEAVLVSADSFTTQQLLNALIGKAVSLWNNNKNTQLGKKQ